MMEHVIKLWKLHADVLKTCLMYFYCRIMHWKSVWNIMLARLLMTLSSSSSRATEESNLCPNDFI